MSAVGRVPGIQRARVRPGGKTGFSLVELLTVVALLAILAGLLFPVLARARESSHQTTCRSNLRQLTKAWLMYAQDYDGRTPGGAYTRWGDKSTGRPVDGAHYTAFWAILPYLRSDKVFVCPTRLGWDASASGSIRDIYRPERGSYAANDQAMDIHESQLGQASELIVFCDSYLPWQDCYARCSTCAGHCSSLIWGRIGRGCYEGDCSKRTDWHDGGVCFAFADGHVKRLPLSAVSYRNWVRNLSVSDPHYNRPITYDW